MIFLRFVLLSLAAAAGLLLGWSFLQQASAPISVPKTEAALEPAPLQHEPQDAPSKPIIDQKAALRDEIEATIETSPEFTPFFQALRTSFPAIFEIFLDEAGHRFNQAHETGGADALMSDAIQILRQSKGKFAANSDSLALLHFFETEIDLLQALAAADQHLCVDFLYGGTSEGFFRFSGDNRVLIENMALASLDAINNGLEQKIERTAPNSEDFALLENALRSKGLENNEIDTLLDGKMQDPPMDDSKLCHLGQVYLQTLSEMPEPSRSRIFALAIELMAKS